MEESACGRRKYLMTFRYPSTNGISLSRRFICSLTGWPGGRDAVLLISPLLNRTTLKVVSEVEDVVSVADVTGGVARQGIET